MTSLNSCTVTNCSFIKIHDFVVRDENTLEYHVFNKLSKMDAKKRRKTLDVHEPQFQKICHNLANLQNLGKGKEKEKAEYFKEPNIFESIKSLMNQEFLTDLTKRTPQVYVPNTFFTQFDYPIADYEKHIAEIEEFNVIKNLNDLNHIREKKQGTKGKMEEKSPEWDEQFKNNKYHKELRQLNEDELKLIKQLPSIKNEKAKNELSQGIRNYFNVTKEEILVLYDFKFMGPKAQLVMEPLEIDCILVNFTKKYIMLIKAKTTLNEEAYKQAKNVLNKCIELIKDWLGGEIEMIDWIVIPAFFFDKKTDEPDLIKKSDESNLILDRVCPNCKNYLIYGGEIHEQMKKMFEKIQPRSQAPENAWNHFQHVARLLLFIMPHEPVQTPTKILDWQRKKRQDIVDSGDGVLRKRKIPRRS